MAVFTRPIFDNDMQAYYSIEEYSNIPFCYSNLKSVPTP